KKAEHNGLASAGSNDNLFVRHINSYSFIILHQFAPIAFISCAMAVFQHFYIGMTNRIKDSWRRFNIRLTDIEMMNMYPSFFSGICKGNEFTDRRRRHLPAAL